MATRYPVERRFTERFVQTESLQALREVVDAGGTAAPGRRAPRRPRRVASWSPCST